MDAGARRLKELIDTTIDSAKGYEEAAREAGDSQFKSLFASRGAERWELVRQLQQAAGLQQGVDEGGTLLAAAHRTFMDLRQALSKGDQAVIDEVERGEAFIKGCYERALNDDDLSPEARTAVLRAYAAVHAAYDQVHNLKQAERARKTHHPGKVQDRTPQ